MRWLYVLALFMALAASDNPEGKGFLSTNKCFQGSRRYFRFILYMTVLHSIVIFSF